MDKNVENLELQEIAEIPVTEDRKQLFAISVDNKGEAKAYPLENIPTKDEVDMAMKDKASAKDMSNAQKDISTLNSTKANQTALTVVQDEVDSSKKELIRLESSKVDKKDFNNSQVAIKRYKDAVTNIGDLPTTGNQEADGRLVRNDKDENGSSYIWVWDGREWSRTPYTKLPSDLVTTSDLYTLLFNEINFTLNEIACASAMQSIDVYGIKDTIKLSTIVNTTIGGTMFPTRIILFNETLNQAATFDFKGASSMYRDIWGGRIFLSADWIKLGDKFINVDGSVARLVFSEKCYKPSTSFPDYVETISSKKTFATAPSVPTPVNDDEPIPLAMFNKVINTQGLSKYLTTKYLSIKGKLAYMEGHNFNTDIELNIEAQEASGITTPASKMNVFKEETNPFFTSVASLFPYLHENKDNPQKIQFKCRVFNSHASASATLMLQFRTKKGGAWHLPTGQTKTIAPNTFEDYTIVFDRGANGWDAFDSIFDIYGSATTTSPESNPVWLHFGNVEMYYIGATNENLRPTISPNLIEPGITEEQLSDDLKNKIENSDTSILPPTQDDDVFSGSSITWGDGRLDGSFVGVVDKHIKEKLSKTLLSDNPLISYSDNPTAFSNDKLYNSRSAKLTGLNKKVSFKLFGDEVAICQVKERTTNYGIMTVKADGVLIGSFDNKNFIGSETESFTGANLKKIQLKHPCTFNHQIKVNGSTIISTNDIGFYTGGYGGSVPADKKAFVYRSLNSQGEPIHEIQLQGLGTITSVNITYSYGQIISHERSTVGQLNDGTTNESRYGSGTTSFDPANPSGGFSSGMEFRAIDRRAFFIHKFTEAKERTFEIEITGGVNPYFNLNFITNRFHNLMNAGIGGWTVNDLINNDKINDYSQFYKWFMPKRLFQESATNDDWTQKTRSITRHIGELAKADLVKLNSLEVATIKHNPISDKYEVEMATGLITAINPWGLTCADIVSSGVQVGDIVRIGNYYGDNMQVVCREIESVNITTGAISWLQQLNAEEIMNITTLDDLVGAECCIRDLSDYQSKYETLIEKVRKVSPQCAIKIVQPGLSNYFTRQLWGYEIVHRRLCAKYPNIRIVEVTEWLYNFQNGNISGASKQAITSTGASSYSLSKTGHWQGFKVLVDGIDVYGRDCHIVSGNAYRPDSSKNGAALNKAHVYDNKGVEVKEALQLVFYKNIPSSGTTIEVQYADSVWSSDYCHPNGVGNYVYAQVLIDELK